MARKSRKQLEAAPETRCGVLLPSSGKVSEGDNSKKELASAQSEFDRNKRFLEGLYESLVSGDISDAEYKDMKSAYEVKITALTEKVKHLRETIHNCVQQEAELTQAHANVQRLEQVSDLTAEIIDKLVDRITVYPNKRIEVKFSFLNEPVYNREEGAENE
jgi:phage-related minor tail protein